MRAARATPSGRRRHGAARVKHVARTDRAQLVAALRAVPRTLRDDLLMTAPGPPHTGESDDPVRRPVTVVAVVLLAVIVAMSGTANLASDYELGRQAGTLLALMESAALVVALYRPVPAWWAVTTVMIVVVLSAGPLAAFRNGLFPWTVSGLAAQAGVLFLLALRVRARIAVEALVISVLAGPACAQFTSAAHNADAGRAAVLLTVPVVVGTALRGRRMARKELVVQEEITVEERARRTLLEERTRIARELHDVVAHHMSVISIQAQAAPHLVENPPDELRENLAGIREHAVGALTELRRVLGVLRDEDAEADGIRHAPQPTLDRLDELVGHVRAAGLTVTTEITGETRPLPPGVGLSAFRIVQEALSNAMQHAPGTEVRVAIIYHASGVTVQVTNTAPRGPAAPSRGMGHGMLGMRERTAMLNGEFAGGPTPEGGYEIVATLPLEERS